MGKYCKFQYTINDWSRFFLTNCLYPTATTENMVPRAVSHKYLDQICKKTGKNQAKMEKNSIPKQIIIAWLIF